MMSIQQDDLKRAVEDKHARLYPDGCPMLCESCAMRLGIRNETEEQRCHRVRDAIARKFGHKTSGLGKVAS